ncbi:MAG: hypothetical protein IKC88_02345, partial [Opitutales bacterium]|nr:hypothetical protein [Opitutales bacterium]
PVRARMLYVSPTYFVPVHPDAPSISSEWETRNIDIPKQTENLNDLLLHIGPDIVPTKYWISQFEVVEKDTGKKVYELDFKSGKLDPRIKYWCNGINRKIKNLPIALKMEKTDGVSDYALTIEKKKESPHLRGFHVYAKGAKLEANKKYIFKVKAKANSKTPRMLDLAVINREQSYKRIAPTTKSHVEPQVRLARDEQIDIVTFPVQASDYYIKEGETPNYSHLESALKSIVDNNPNAKILVRIRFYPSAKWLKENPDSALTFGNGEKSIHFPSMSSLKYRKQSQDALRMIIDYAEKHYGKNIIGYHP